MLKLLLAAIILCLSSCATLFSNSEDAISFTSEPLGATIYVNGFPIGKTPVTFNVDRATFKQSEVVVKLEGYEAKNFLLGRTLATSAIFNLTCWPSWLTDATSGNMIEYSPRAYFIDLRKNKSSQSEVKRTYFVMINHKALLNDLARGDGEFLRSYLDLTELSFDKKQTLKNLMVKNSAHYLSLTWPNQLYHDLEIELKAI